MRHVQTASRHPQQAAKVAKTIPANSCNLSAAYTLVPLGYVAQYFTQTVIAASSSAHQECLVGLHSCTYTCSISAYLLLLTNERITMVDSSPWKLSMVATRTAALRLVLLRTALLPVANIL